ncbi:DUF1778 domain-containing protein [Mesorhizobium tamadayense]|uniref:DUF1778 domain-containing protein n=1 Tax=Mesorhizobium tamadayense TaxID=425306 RepID=A0A3P3G3W2_9HYPH|nr:DUF1778 domain-containing protein [Mesorhizobium tamadayense]RRI05474.1 DUF1778 domain-containing protein [Mesorhizobium tamadayense]
MPSRKTPRGALAEVAQETNNEIASIRLSTADQLALVEAIVNPPEPNDALRKPPTPTKALSLNLGSRARPR